MKLFQRKAQKQVKKSAQKEMKAKKRGKKFSVPSKRAAKKSKFKGGHYLY